ncbi:ABC1 kinase family protein [Ktedonospora formicarum]|uniref:ABC1 atypical kinase-like domain-containing protein n=1 Tax=Ktedonospora formicarum TaxID=2778364 RepID=A0A8J3I1J6_9CHLR|nr:AarF/ABC1/UbiB kinase family protein [Ktedonospora formicarum]GHO43819.1 hypothetical protein KSX_19820 [Ktedonospora formicarum]
MRIEPRGINRFAQIVRFLRVSRLLLWTLWVIYRERQRVVKARQRGNYEVQPNIEVLLKVLRAFRETALRLGVLMIKLGQFLSARADMLPEQALSVLADLQDEVPPAPFEHVTAVIEKEYGKPLTEIFSSFERECTAAASLGQVHRATLASTGETVAVKVQRPHIAQLVSMDLSTLKFVIWVVKRFVKSDFIDLNGLYREFRRTVYEEIDYITEATNAKRFREMFKDDPTIYIPTIHEEYISRHVLVIEWIDGIKINDYKALDTAGYSRLETANRTVKAYFHQFFEEGFFHADPHPGNIFVRKGSAPDNPVIAFIDFGMVGTLTSPIKRGLRDLFLALVLSDAKKMADALHRLGFIGEGANMASIEQGLSLLLENYYGMTLGQARELEVSNVAHDLDNLLYGQPFRIPSQFAFAGRAVSTLVGVSTGLAPTFNFVDVATPYARKFLDLNAEGIGKIAQDVLKEAVGAGQVLLRLPAAIDRLVGKIEAGQIEVRLANLPGSGRRARRGNNGATLSNGGSFGGLTWSFFFGTSLAAGVYLTSLQLAAPGWFCLGIAGISALGLLFRR